MLSDVEDPDQELQRLAVDAEGERFTALAEGDSDAIQARNDATINELSVGLQPQIATAIDAISDAALAETLRRSSTTA
jgi:hypothetical protein